MQHKLSTLARIVNALNQNQVVWALGASAMLYLRGIVSEFHDLDLMIAEESVERAKAALAPLGILHDLQPTTQYQTQCFLEYTIDQVDVDMISGFVVVHKGTPYTMPFDSSHIDQHVMIAGVSVPLQSLSDWVQYYALMDRTQKAVLLQQYL